MASIRKRKDKYQAQVRINGQSTSKTFTSLANAKSWARCMETKAEASSISIKKYQPANFAEVLEVYLEKVTPLKGNTSVEPIIIRLLMRSDWVQKPLSLLTTADVAAYRDERLREVKSSSLHRQFCIIKHAAKIAEEEWGWDACSHVFNSIKIRRTPPSGVKRLSEVDTQCLIHAAASCRNRLMQPLIMLALETGMRRGELLSLRWDGVDFNHHQISLQKTKSGYPRRIPMTQTSEGVLKALWEASEGQGGLVFNLSPNAVRLAFGRIRQRSGLPGVRFHDLRHEAISRLFERGLTMPEVASISGHRSLSQLMRYSHADTKSLVNKMRR
jgi:integrase